MNFDPATVQPGKDLETREVPTAFRRFLAASIDAVLLVIPTSFFATLGVLGVVWLLYAPIFDFVAHLDDPKSRANLVDYMLDVHPDHVPARIRAVDLLEGRAAAHLEAESASFTFQLAGPSARFVVSGESVPLDQRFHLNLTDLVPKFVARLIQFGFAVFYFAVLGSGGRRTIGKWACGLEVVHITGRPPKLLEAYLRFFGYFITLGSGFGLLAYFREPNGRAAHDRLVNTVVLRT